jgi:hypothetical protein
VRLATQSAQRIDCKIEDSQKEVDGGQRQEQLQFHQKLNSKKTKEKPKN